MNRKPIELTRKDLIDTILQIPALKERGWTALDLAGHTNLELVKFYDQHETDPCDIKVKAERWIPIKEERAWGYA